ncbi:MAG TPA: hypothetical protein VM287_04540 [Egibacteraceae bacterium]|nr:hypothetical protein [Egibacteraceae bacterium]
MAKLDRFDMAIPAPPWPSPWGPGGYFAADLGLLATLLSLAVGTAQASGIVAGAADMWAAHELRRAGFDPDEVWPRSPGPRVMPRDIAHMMRPQGGLTVGLRQDLEARFPRMTKSLPADPSVLGAVYSKQADVLVASWSAGIELMVSTKTMLSSFKKNLRNRFEEAYGDARNLRTRHPLAALGFLYVLSSKASASDRGFAEDMLRKLRQPDAYDAVTLIVMETAAEIQEEEPDEVGLPPDEEAPSLAVDPPTHEGDAEGDDVPETEAGDDQPAAAAEVVLLDVPEDLHPDRFFGDLIGAALGRTPIGMYKGVREKLAHG